MKTTQTLTRYALLAALALSIAGTYQAKALDISFSPYAHDDRGYWDEHHHHHDFVTYHHHRGYWDERSGTRVWISVD